MANFVFRITLPPRPWPFSWGPWGTSEEKICREMDAGTIEIWQFDRKAKGMANEPMEITCNTGSASCTTTVECNARECKTRSLLRRTRL